MLVCEEDGFRRAPPYGAEFHQRLIVASGVETDRHILGFCRVDEEQAHEQDHLGIECWTGRASKHRFRTRRQAAPAAAAVAPGDASSLQQKVVDDFP